MNNIQIVVFLYIILRVIIFIVFFVSIIGCHFILCYINSFLYLQIQLYDTFSFSLHHVQWILCYRIKNIAILHDIYKATEAKECKFAIQTGALPTKERVVGSNPLLGTWKFFFFLSFPPLLSFPFLTLRVYPGVHGCFSLDKNG